MKPRDVFGNLAFDPLEGFFTRERHQRILHNIQDNAKPVLDSKSRKVRVLEQSPKPDPNSQKRNVDEKNGSDCRPLPRYDDIVPLNEVHHAL
mmetsp:Transcript_10996/g.12077  ORF Transcript_10996/g.12077 Transcript_10996/m.12077 type:complete len:92 (-) Transcript_10996:78-353(-)